MTAQQWNPLVLDTARASTRISHDGEKWCVIKPRDLGRPWCYGEVTVRFRSYQQAQKLYAYCLTLTVLQASGFRVLNAESAAQVAVYVMRPMSLQNTIAEAFRIASSLTQ